MKWQKPLPKPSNEQRIREMSDRVLNPDKCGQQDGRRKGQPGLQEVGINS